MQVYFRKKISDTFKSMILLSLLETTFSLPFSGSLIVLYYFSGLSQDMLQNFTGIANIVCVILATLVVWVFYTFSDKELKSRVFSKKRKAGLRVIISGTMIIFAFQFFQIFPTAFMESVFNSFGFTFSQSAYSETVSELSLMSVIYAGFLAPVIEEIVYRGLALKPLLSYGRNLAIVLSSLIFSLAHADFNQFVFTFLTGLVLGYVSAEYSIYSSMLLHMINNIFALLANLSLNLDQNGFSYLIFNIIIMVSFIGACIFICLKRHGIVGYIKAGRHIEGAKISAVFLNIWFYLFLIWQIYLTSFNISAL